MKGKSISITVLCHWLVKVCEGDFPQQVEPADYAVVGIFRSRNPLQKSMVSDQSAKASHSSVACHCSAGINFLLAHKTRCSVSLNATLCMRRCAPWKGVCQSALRKSSPLLQGPARGRSLKSFPLSSLEVEYVRGFTASIWLWSTIRRILCEVKDGGRLSWYSGIQKIRCQTFHRPAVHALPTHWLQCWLLSDNHISSHSKTSQNWFYLGFIQVQMLTLMFAI